MRERSRIKILRLLKKILSRLDLTNSESVEVSPTFCVLPWVHIGTKPDGTLNLCCIASSEVLKDKNSNPCRMDSDSVADIWNCHSIKKIRQNMLAGQKISACETCYLDESNKKQSARQKKNADWMRRLGSHELKKRISESLKNDGHVSSPPVYFDLRMGNKCNLRCRMCFPLNSHSLNQEIREITTAQLPFPSFYKNMVLSEDQMIFWGDSDRFLKSMDTSLLHLREIYLTGGEPMLIKATESLLRRACELKVAHNINLTFHTNATIWNKNIVELLPHFARVDIICSIDGVGKTDEYVRYPTQFGKVDDVFKKYLDLCLQQTNIFLSIGVSISWLNIFELPAFCNWLTKTGASQAHSFLGVWLNMVYFPNFLSIEMLPAHLKKEAISALHLCSRILQSSSLATAQIESDLSAISQLLEQNRLPNHEAVLDLIRQTKTFDQHRKQSLHDFIPSASRVFDYYSSTTGEAHGPQ